jgi:hypothetical protein
MTRTWWIIVLVAVGVGLAILIGVLGTRNEPSKTEATSSLCSSLTALESSLKTLTGLDPSTASKSQYQSDVTAVENDWSTVKSDAQAVENAPTGDLDSAWDDFSSAVKNVPNDASVSDALNDVTQSADQLVSTAQSTASEVNCS